jgi:alkanesulfonate monooxygenase SsuD/methylene tetrahydromethanopterin reductase-like flavin-dependent oxidoreductase (luciferase family)
MTHWFPLGLEGLRHKNEVLEGYCAEIGRDPGTIARTMSAPVIVTGDEAEAKSIVELIPPERRPYLAVGPPEQAADALRPYIDAGFTGFTFNNNIYPTPEQISRIGDLLKLVASEAPVGAR